MNSTSETDTKDRSSRCHGGRFGRRRWIKVPFIIAAIVLIKSAVVMLLWNGLVPELFHGPILSYCQALGITVLVKILVGFGHGPAHMKGMMMRHHLQHKFAHMSPEEREKCLEELKKNGCDKFC